MKSVLGGIKTKLESEFDRLNRWVWTGEETAKLVIFAVGIAYLFLSDVFYQIGEFVGENIGTTLIN